MIIPTCEMYIKMLNREIRHPTEEVIGYIQGFRDCLDIFIESLPQDYKRRMPTLPDKDKVLEEFRKAYAK